MPRAWLGPAVRLCPGAARTESDAAPEKAFCRLDAFSSPPFPFGPSPHATTPGSIPPSLRSRLPIIRRANPARFCPAVQVLSAGRSLSRTKYDLPVAVATVATQVGVLPEIYLQCDWARCAIKYHRSAAGKRGPGTRVPELEAGVIDGRRLFGLHIESDM